MAFGRPVPSSPTAWGEPRSSLTLPCAVSIRQAFCRLGFGAACLTSCHVFKVQTFEVCASVAFNAHRELCSHHHGLIPDISITPKGSPCPFSLSATPRPSPVPFLSPSPAHPPPPFLFSFQFLFAALPPSLSAFSHLRLVPCLSLRPTLPLFCSTLECASASLLCSKGDTGETQENKFEKQR